MSLEFLQQSNGQMMHHQVQPYNGAPNLVAPYHPMVYPLVNTGSHPQVGRQHYFPSSLVQPFNNAQVSYWLTCFTRVVFLILGCWMFGTVRINSLVVGDGFLGNKPHRHTRSRWRCFCGQRGYANGENGGRSSFPIEPTSVLFVRTFTPVAISHRLTEYLFFSVLSRFFSFFKDFRSDWPSEPCCQLAPLFLLCFIPCVTGGDCGGMRHSPTVLHRQFSLPNPAPPAMYTLRPRIQQQHQLPMSGSSQRPVTVSSFQNQQQQQQQQGALGFASRQVRTRRQVFRPHLAAGYTTVTDPSSVMPLHQSCSSSPVQQFPSTTSWTVVLL